MAKTCKSCGKEYKGEFCEHCGYGDPNLTVKAAEKYKTNTPVRFMTPEQKETYYAELKKKQAQQRSTGKRKKDPKMMRAMIITVIAAVLIIFGTLFGTGVIGFAEKETDVVEKYLKAINDRDFDKYASCFPNEMRKDYEADLTATGLSEKEYMDLFNADFAEEYGADFTITYTILKSDEMTEYSTDGYKEAYGTVPNISEAKLVITDVTFKGSKGSEKFRMNFYVGKVGRRWKLFNLEYDAGIITPNMEINNPDDNTESDNIEANTSSEE